MRNRTKEMVVLGVLLAPLLIGESQGGRPQQAVDDGVGGFKAKAISHLAPRAYWDETGDEEVQNIAQGLAHFREAILKNKESFTASQKMAAWKLYLLFKDQAPFEGRQGELSPLDAKSTWSLEDFGLNSEDESQLSLGLWERKHKWQRAYVPPFDENSVQPFMGAYTAGLFWYLKRQSSLAVTLSSLSALGLSLYGLTSYDTRRYVNSLRKCFQADI